MAYDSTLVVYTGIPLTTINVTAGMNLQTALNNINTAVATVIVTDYSSFNYGPYYGYTLKTPLGASITTITGFVEGTASGIGKVSSDLATFTGTTFPSYQSAIATAISNLQVPGLAYSNNTGGLPISIANTDNQLTILTKLANAIGDTGNLLAAPGNAWSLLSITQPTTIYDAFNELINYNITQNSVIAGKEASIGTFNNSINCLVTVGGTSTDTAGETIDLLTQYVCALDKFDGTAIYGVSCLTPQSNLQDWIQQLVNIAETNSTNRFAYVDVSMTTTPNACNGFTIGVDPIWTGLRNVAASVQDTTPGDLTDKLAAGTNVSFTTLNPGANEQIEINVALPTLNKVAINSLDSTPDYLAAKIVPNAGNWGLTTSVLTNTSNSQLVISTLVNDPSTLVQNIINYISTDPAFLAAFCALQTQCLGCQCAAATVTSIGLDIPTNVYTIYWTPGAGVATQTVSYREVGAVDWISNVNISPANPQLNSAVTADVLNLNFNTPYDFQVVSNCSGISNYSSVQQSIIYDQQPLTDGVNQGVISVNQAPMMAIDVVQYTLTDQNYVPIETLPVVTGTNPIGVFSAQGSGTYYVQYRYGTLINGVMLYSDDPSQQGSVYLSNAIMVP